MCTCTCFDVVLPYKNLVLDEISVDKRTAYFYSLQVLAHSIDD